MEHFWLVGLLCCVLLLRGTSSEKIGPAKILSNNEPVTISAALKRPGRTTTVYGFLDFTTTIDNTEVVFRPSSASTASSTTIQPSKASSEPEVKNSRPPAMERLHQLNNKLRSQASSASLTPATERSSSSGRNKLPVIKTGRTSTTDGSNSKNPRIAPTPTLGRTTSSSAAQVPQSLPRRGTPASLAEKRRRFLASARRSDSSSSLPKVASAARLRGSSSRDSPLLAALNRDETLTDQEMAETIEVSPSKVKRFQEYTNLSTFFAVPGSGNSTRDRSRLLVRKLTRRPPSQPTEGGKSRLLPYRRSGPKNRLTFAGSRALAADDEEASEPKIVASRAVESVASLDIEASSVASRPFEPSSATIAEYLHDSDEDAIDSAPLNSLILPSLSAPTEKNDADGPAITSAVPELEGSQSDAGLLLASSVDTSSTGPTMPLPVVKASAGDRDPGLTVPLQLSIVTSTFSQTETRLRTSLLPVYDGTSTTYYTLTHSFLVTKSVTTFQTVPPEEFMPYLIPGNNDSYYSINDVFEDLEDVPPHLLQRKSDVDDENASEEELLDKSGTEHVTVPDPKADSSTANPAYPMGNPLLGNLPFLNLLGPAAALGLNPYFPYGLGLPPQVVTTSRPVFSTDVIFTSKLLPIIDGLTTSYHTVREAASTVTHTSFETFTTQLAPQNPLGLGTNNLAPNPLQQAAMPQQPMSTVTSSHTFVTTETQIATQVFKLMYDGYKTSYRTVSSSTVVTRTISTYTTTTVPVYTQMLPFFG